LINYEIKKSLYEILSQDYEIIFITLSIRKYKVNIDMSKNMR